MSGNYSTKKLKVAILGTGNIGSDLLSKVLRSEFLEVGIFAGRNLDSFGMKRALSLNIPVSDRSITYIEENPDCCDIVFDATTASSHIVHAGILKKLNKFVVDLTPAHVGPFCIPSINQDIVCNSNNVNMVTCGGQASVPIAYAIAKASKDLKYLEIVATISSKSAGIGTRNNIDEFTQTTREALTEFTGIKHTKAIIILNPAEPPITMHNTIYAIVDNPDMELITKSVKEMEANIRKYVPGYNILTGPIYENGRVTTTVSVKGAGDFLPEYSGNLDIINCAAIEVAERYALQRLSV